MKKILFSLLLVLSCTITSAQKKSEVLEAVCKTVDEYFMPDFNDAIEFPEWRDPDNTKGLASCSRVYIEPNHFFRNGKVCSSYIAWVNQYCSQSLNSKVIEHVLTLDENIQKVKGDNDLYRIGATLERKWVNEDGPDIPTEQITLTFQWRGAGKLVYIMHLDGDISPIKLPVPVKAPVTQQMVAADSDMNVHISRNIGNSDYVSDRSTMGYLFDEWLEKQDNGKNKYFYYLIIAIVIIIGLFVFNKNYNYRSVQDWMILGVASMVALIILVLLDVGAIGIDMYRGTYVGKKVRSYMLQAYDAHRLAVPGQAIAVSKDGKWGLVDFAGKVTQPLELDSISEFHQGFAIAYLNGYAAFLPASGVEKLAWCNRITPLREGKSLVEVIQRDENKKKISKYYLFDINGTSGPGYTLLPYDYISFRNPVDLNRYTVSKDNKYGIIDGEGNIIAPLEYNSICSAYHDDMIEVSKEFGGKNNKERWKNRRYGYLDLNGKLVIPLVYHNAEHFSEGLAAVENDKYKLGYIDKKGNLVIPYKFIDTREFRNGRAVVRANIYGGPWGAIDRQGNWIVKPEHQDPSGAYNALP